LNYARRHAGLDVHGSAVKEKLTRRFRVKGRGASPASHHPLHHRCADLTPTMWAGHRPWSSVGAVGSLVTLLAADCGDGIGTQTGGAGAVDGPTTIATTSIWADVVSNVACDGQAKVELLIPIGSDPHTAEPSLADRERMENAALVVANGLLLEEGLQDTVDSVEAAELEELAHVIDETGVPAIFAETQHTVAESQAMAERVGDVEVVTLFTDTLGESSSGADTYVGLLRTNAKLIADALS
jgi:ABC-type Zn uptake system ZnuABC Zn-binding protein ZnuA